LASGSTRPPGTATNPHAGIPPVPSGWGAPWGFGFRASGFQVVQFFAQVAAGLLEVEEFLAEVFEIVHGLAAGAQVGDGPLGGGLPWGALGGVGEGLEGGNGLGVAQGAQGANRGQLDGALLVIEAAEQELAGGVLFLLVARQVSQRAQPLGKTGGGQVGLALGEGRKQGRQEGGVVLRAHGGDGGVGQFVAIGIGVEKLEQERAGLGRGIAGEVADGRGQDVRVFLGVQGAAAVGFSGPGARFV